LITERLSSIISNVQTEDIVYLALSKSLNYAVTPAVVPIEGTLYCVEKALGALPEETAEEVQHETVSPRTT
jgi:hypothetical protein